jgi:hypothetical protein
LCSSGLKQRTTKGIRPHLERVGQREVLMSFDQDSKLLLEIYQLLYFQIISGCISRKYQIRSQKING